MGIIINMMAFNLSSPADVVHDLAIRARQRRIDANLTQRELAAKADISYSTLRLFEDTGKVALETLVKIAFVLGAEGEFERLFPPRAPRTIDDVVDRPRRQRVRKS